MAETGHRSLLLLCFHGSTVRQQGNTLHFTSIPPQMCSLRITDYVEEEGKHG